MRAAGVTYRHSSANKSGVNRASLCTLVATKSGVNRVLRVAELGFHWDLSMHHRRPKACHGKAHKARQQHVAYVELLACAFRVTRCLESSQISITVALN